VLEVVEGKKLAWTSALGPGYRPAEMGEGCESFPMTAIVTFADAGNGKTAYKAVALHKDAKDRDTHEQMGFQDGWGTTAQQLEEFAKTLSVNA
ncbi:MAG TPA: SRPBCC domain-containing protein, partial [Sphingomicrobium sp.]|nr:SRPBCC domain-containing protein [Sphingomicrobium sp.]